MDDAVGVLWFKSARPQKGFGLGLVNREGRAATAEDFAFFLEGLEREAGVFAQRNGLSVALDPPAVDPARVTRKDISEYLYHDLALNVRRFHRHLAWLKELGRIPILLPKPGAIACGEELIGREKLIGEIAETIKTQSVSLRAPRRFGKSSILYYFLTHSPSGWRPIFCELWGIHTIATFGGELAARLLPARTSPTDAQKERERASRQIVDAGDNWMNALDGLLPAGRGKTRPLLLLDEFAQFLRNLKQSGQITGFLEWLARRTESGSLRLIMASSQSEERLAGEHWEKLKDSVRRIDVHELDVEDACDLFDELCFNEQIPITRRDVENGVSLVGRVPFFIHVFVASWKGMRSAQPPDSTGHPPRPVSVAEVYEKAMLGKFGHQHLREFQRLLHRYPPDQEKAARTILNHLAALRQEGTNQEMLKEICRKECGNADFDDTLDLLQEDLLVRQLPGTPKKFAFASRLLKDFWIRYPVR